MPMIRALSLSVMYPFRIPFSINTVRLVGVPSSSTFSEPRRNGSVPSSTMVQSVEATTWPTRSVKAEVFLRLKSASSPWPIASWSRIPGQPEPSTTIIGPRDLIDPLQERDLLRRRNFRGRHGHRVEVLGRFPDPDRRHGASARRRSCDVAGRVGGLLQLFQRDLIRVGIAGLLTGRRPHPHALGDALRGALDQTLLHRNGFVHGVLKIEIRVVHVADLDPPHRGQELAVGHPEPLQVKLFRLFGLSHWVPFGSAYSFFRLRISSSKVLRYSVSHSGEPSASGRE